MSKKPNMAAQQKMAVKDVFEIVMFEFWLRFYFLKEEDGKLFYSVPEETVEAVREQQEHLVGLVEMINGDEVDQESSTKNVCNYVAGRLDGIVYTEGVIDKIWGSREYKLENYLFNVWAKMHENLLDTRVFSLNEWKENYAEWKKTDEVKQYMSKLVLAPGQVTGTTQ